jgi:hypothetical protein
MPRDQISFQCSLCAEKVSRLKSHVSSLAQATRAENSPINSSNNSTISAGKREEKSHVSNLMSHVWRRQAGRKVSRLQSHVSSLAQASGKKSLTSPISCLKSSAGKREEKSPISCLMSSAGKREEKSPISCLKSSEGKREEKSHVSSLAQATRAAPNSPKLRSHSAVRHQQFDRCR